MMIYQNEILHQVGNAPVCDDEEPSDWPWNASLVSVVFLNGLLCVCHADRGIGSLVARLSVPAARHQLHTPKTSEHVPSVATQP
jgi:hypothetical protein